jgi:hypothetical protein
MFGAGFTPWCGRVMKREKGQGVRGKEKKEEIKFSWETKRGMNF